MKSARLKFNGPWVCDYFYREVEQPRHLAILLHGYLQTGRGLYRLLDRSIPKDWAVISPNAPFPIPQSHQGQYRVGYSWYFYDRERDEYLIDTEVSLAFVANLVRALKLNSIPKTLIGFSQGGYLSPALGLSLSHVRRIVGIGCEFFSDELAKTPSFRMDQIHGTADPVVSCEDALRNHEKLQARGVRGEFHTIPGLEHTLAPEVQTLLQRLLQK